MILQGVTLTCLPVWRVQTISLLVTPEDSPGPQDP
jgi:hypothetical protein